jgi:multicomponent K+:H+ antiporter subunit D
MTKVGAYAIIRVYTMIFPPQLEATSGLEDVLVDARRAECRWRSDDPGSSPGKIAGSSCRFPSSGPWVWSWFAISLMTPDGIAAAHYIVHSTPCGSLFLIVDLVKSSRPSLCR